MIRKLGKLGQSRISYPGMVLGRPGLVGYWPLSGFGQFQHNALALTGTAGCYASCPDSAALSDPGDKDIRVKAAMANWVPAATQCLVSKFLTTGNQMSWEIFVYTNGRIYLQLYTDGTVGSLVSYNSSVITGLAAGDNKFIRVALDVDNGAGHSVATFYTSDDGSNWAQLGTPHSTNGVVSIFDSSSNINVGAASNGATQVPIGRIYSVEIRNGINGTIVASPNFNQPPGTTSFADAQGNTWTVNGPIAADWTANANDGQYMPFSGTSWTGGTLANVQSPIAGEVYKYPGFNGTSGYGLVANNAAFNLTDAIGIEMWVNVTGGTSPIFLAKRDNSNYSWEIGLTGTYPGFNLLFRVNGNGNNIIGGNFTANGAWVHLAVGYNRTSLTGYVNGVALTPVAYTSAINVTTTGITIGGRNLFTGAEARLAGSIAHVALYNRVLDPREVWQSYDYCHRRVG